MFPSTDIFLQEYTPDNANILKTVTGFEGSNGVALFNDDGKNIFWTDSRYTIEAKKLFNQDEWVVLDIKEAPIIKTIAKYTKNLKLDTKFFSYSFLSKLLEIKEIKVEFCDYYKDFTDKITLLPSKPYRYEIKYAGKSVKDKITDLHDHLNKNNLDGIFLHDPHDVNWLLNIRGSDLTYTPIVNCFALILKDEINIFINTNSDEIFKEIEEEINIKINVYSINELEKIKEITKNQNCKSFIESSKACSYYIYDLLKKSATVKEVQHNYITEQKAIKNDTEIKWIKKAHELDGKAIDEFLTWLEDNFKHEEDGIYGKEKITELDASEKLLQCRKKHGGDLFQGNSFETISSTGANGAIVHYKARQKTQATLKRGDLYLVDSGGQYLGATTDCTRVICLGGNPTKEQKKHYNLVLQGNKALANAKFKKGLCGRDLDILARQFLYKEGLDYGHGTGHGVGSFLSVHEGPCNISPLSQYSLKAGMVISNEPGFYLEGEYGIRIEDLLLVVESKDKGFLEFEVLTKARFKEWN